jgi:hypothetical protein
VEHLRLPGHAHARSDTHWRPVRVVLLTPFVPFALLPAIISPGFTIASDETL